MADVLFKKGLQASYDGLANKVATTFYYTTDEKNLYIGDVKLSNAADVEAAISRITGAEGNITALKAIVDKLDGDVTVEGSVKKQIKDAIGAIGLKAIATSGAAADVTVKDEAGNFATDNVEAALTELASKINSTGEAGELSIETASAEDAAKAGYAAVYTFKQGTKTVGTINIAKDMVATSGELVNADADGNTGTFIKLTIANSEKPVYINVADLIEYNAVSNADGAEIILSESEDHTISATLAHIAGSKIDDGTVAKTKLDTAVQTSLDKADSALQATDKTDLEGKITKAQDAAGAAQADVDALETVVGKAADAETSTAATGIFKKIDDAVSAQATKDNDQDTKITALENAVGAGGSVDTQIQNAIGALDVTDVPTATVDATDSTKVTINSISETDGKIAKGATTVDVDAFGTAKAVQDAVTGTTADSADKVTLYGVKAYAKAYADGLAGDYATADQGKKADTALQAADITTGTANGAIAVKGTDVPVKGLGSAAYTESTAYDAAGAADAVSATLKGVSTDKKDAETIYGAKAYADDAVNAALTWEEF